MPFKSQYIPYQNTGAFSRIIIDYLGNVPALQPYYGYSPGIDAIKEAISNRKKYPINRKVLVEQFQQQYKEDGSASKISDNISLLSKENTFTVCTAHQPNIFTGHLYFIYKILHTIKLAEELNAGISDHHFVPIYYMGSEDADLQELGEISINGKKYPWKTKQSGAVGRMVIDKEFISLIDEIEGQLGVEKFGIELISLIRSCYTTGKSIEQSTFEFVNELFAEYGLLILLPDTKALKKEFIPVIKKELEEQFSNQCVQESIENFPVEYKVQAVGRDINLFYLKDNIRERIEATKNGFRVSNTSLSFSKEEMKHEVEKHPERFSQNVILRPVYQELILPNIAFIGGGGELAYWLELGKVFDAVQVHFPMLVLRNSFMIINKRTAHKIASLNFSTTDIFKSTDKLINELVKRESAARLQLDKEKLVLQDLYKKIEAIAAVVDPTLQKHAQALCVQALKRLGSLEKKMLKAEKKKFEAEQRQVQKIKSLLFPGGILQERVDNILPYYAQWGPGFINEIYRFSKIFDQEFCIMEEIEKTGNVKYQM